jgi:hypothetical protein
MKEASKVIALALFSPFPLRTRRAKLLVASSTFSLPFSPFSLRTRTKLPDLAVICQPGDLLYSTLPCWWQCSEQP